MKRDPESGILIPAKSAGDDEKIRSSRRHMKWAADHGSEIVRPGIQDRIVRSVSKILAEVGPEKAAQIREDRMASIRLRANELRSQSDVRLENMDDHIRSVLSSSGKDRVHACLLEELGIR